MWDAVSGSPSAGDGLGGGLEAGAMDSLLPQHMRNELRGLSPDPGWHGGVFAASQERTGAELQLQGKGQALQPKGGGSWMPGCPRGRAASLPGLGPNG